MSTKSTLQASLTVEKNNRNIHAFIPLDNQILFNYGCHSFGHQAGLLKYKIKFKIDLKNLEGLRIKSTIK